MKKKKKHERKRKQKRIKESMQLKDYGGRGTDERKEEELRKERNRN